MKNKAIFLTLFLIAIMLSSSSVFAQEVDVYQPEVLEIKIEEQTQTKVLQPEISPQIQVQNEIKTNAQVQNKEQKQEKKQVKTQSKKQFRKQQGKEKENTQNQMREMSSEGLVQVKTQEQNQVNVYNRNEDQAMTHVRGKGGK